MFLYFSRISCSWNYNIEILKLEETKCIERPWNWMGESQFPELPACSMSGPPFSSVWKSLSRGFVSTVNPANNHFPPVPPFGQRLGSAPAIWLVWDYISLGAGQSTSKPGILAWWALDRGAYCLSPPLPAAGATCPLTRKPAGTSQGRALELDMVPVWLRCLAIQLGRVRTWGRQRGDRPCCGLSNGPVVQLERACRLPSPAPIHRERHPLPLVTPCTSAASPGPHSSMIQLHLLSHSSSLCMQKQKGKWLPWKKAQFFKWGRSGSFETVGNSSGILKNILISAVGAGLACATADRYTFKENVGNISLNGTSYLENF